MIIKPGEPHMLDLLKKHAEGARVDSVKIPNDSKVWAFIKALRSEKNIAPHNLFIKPLLTIDPGKTTGMAIWEPLTSNILLFQLETPSCAEAYDKLWPIVNYLSLDKPRLSHVRYEDYRVYGHMTETHSFSELHTARIIGVIEVVCHLAQVPWTNALAIHAKSFWTDDKLKMCGIYNRGMRHARDAQRHLLRYMSERESPNA